MAALYGTVYVSQSPHFCSHTLFRMCSCISTCIYVHPTPYVSSTFYALLHGTLDFAVWQCAYMCVSQAPYNWSYTLIKMCTCISTWIHVHLTYHVCFTFLNSYMEMWVSLCGSVCFAASLLVVPHLE